MSAPSVHLTLCFAISAFFFSANPTFAQLKPTRQDKSQIIRFILRTYDFTDSEVWEPNDENTILLLDENLSPADIPVRKGVKFKLVKQNELDRLAKTEVEYYEFGPFEIRKTLVRISFMRRYRSTSGINGSTMEYTCRKVARRWKLKAHLDGRYAS